MIDNKVKQGYQFKDFIPLIIIFLIIIIFTTARSYIAQHYNPHEIMMNFMGSFFIVFGFFKIIKLTSFAEAYSMYDLIAKRSRIYALAYPFIEVTLGILYLMHVESPIINIITLIIMLISSAGVLTELLKGREIICACLGTVFKIPMTYVTLIEDLLMALMALFMLFTK